MIRGIKGLICFGATAGALAAPVGAGAVTLVDQFPNGTFTVPTVPSFDVPAAQLDNQAADDFTIPDGLAYVVQSVSVVGKDSLGTGTDTANVTLYEDVGVPGQPLFSQAGIPAATCSVNNTCNFTATLTGAPLLGPGTYWISVQSSGPFRWRWAATPPGAPLGAAALWQNPGDGLTTGCNTWRTLLQCTWTAATDGTDLIYRLDGDAFDSRFALGSFSAKGTKLFIAATFPGPGQVALGGKGLKPKTKTVATGERKLKLKLKPSVKHRLNRGRKANVRLDAAFTATGGVPYEAVREGQAHSPPSGRASRVASAALATEQPRRDHLLRVMTPRLDVRLLPSHRRRGAIHGQGFQGKDRPRHPGFRARLGAVSAARSAARALRTCCSSPGMTSATGRWTSSAARWRRRTCAASPRWACGTRTSTPPRSARRPGPRC